MKPVEAATAHTRRGPSKYEFEGPRHEVGLRSPVSRASAAVQSAVLTPALPPLLTESFRLRVTFHLADPASTRGLSGRTVRRCFRSRPHLAVRKRFLTGVVKSPQVVFQRFSRKF